MADSASLGSVPARRDEQPSQSTLPTRTLSREDIELAEHLVDHSQGVRESRERPTERQLLDHSHEIKSNRSETYSNQYARTVTPPRSQGGGRSQQSASYSPQPPPTDNAPTGQICSNCGTTSTPLWRRSPQGNTICNACGLYQKARNTARPTTMNRHIQHGAGQGEQAQRFNTHFGTATAHYVQADQTSGGSCPGGGKCNGTGGASGCGGCPAFNNRVSKSANITIAPQRSCSGEAGNAPEPIDINALQAPSQTVVVACQNCETTITPLWRRDAEGHTICNACGLYYKLHGKHRPQTMKKSVIKRRKRVVPASLTGEAQQMDGGHTSNSPESEDGRADEAYPPAPRGAPNPDGSISLGFRPRQASRHLPEPPRQNGHAHNALPQNDLGSYTSQPQMGGQPDGSSLNVDNRLPPMAAYPSPGHRPSSLSPNFLLTPNSRKRSFSATNDVDSQQQQAQQQQHYAMQQARIETQQQQQQQPGDSQRLSSIKSILNPSQMAGASGDETTLDPSLRTPAQSQQRSPAMGYVPVAQMSGSDGAKIEEGDSEVERQKKARREMLRREAERMREDLRRKEQELEELGGL